MNPDHSVPPVIRVQLFASYAERLGGEVLELPASDIRTAGDVLARLRALPRGEVIGPATLIAVNLRHAPLTMVVNPGDDVAVMPPLAGG